MTTRWVGLATALAVLACGGGDVPLPPPPLDTGKVVVVPTPEPPAPADDSCPDGVFLAYGWPGEWPSPIVQVTASTQVQGYTAPCEPTPTVSCTVPPGLYHPWQAGDVTYKSTSVVQAFELTEAIEVGGKERPAGTTVVMQSYLAEGYCILSIDGEEAEDSCPEMMGLAPDGPYKRAGEPVEFPERQLFQVTCEGGEQAWLVPEDVLAQPTAQPGEYLEYGRVGPKGSGGF